MNAAALPPYLECLNPEQREAVLHTGKPETTVSPETQVSPRDHIRPLLILAGAGSGKTRVITTKIAYLIREQGFDPRSILAVTFTNKAAREMAERARLIDDRAAYAMLRTFHSFGAWFLRRNGSLGGLDSGFIIYDDDDSTALLSTIMEDAPRAEVKITAHTIARAKDYFLSPDDPELDLINHRKQFRRVYAQYEEKLAQIGNVDFGDLIKKPVEILRANPEVARRFRDRFRVIMVDEYQDSNIAQFELLKELCGPDTYLCVVGDDDQSIYRFRGAEVKNILEFPERFGGADIIRLERNYRSFSPILNLASSVVNHNSGRLGKILKAERGSGKRPALVFLPDQDAEAAFCAELIENSMKAGKDGGKPRYSDWAVLYRTNAQSLGFETEFLRRRVPYRVVGSLKFYEREEIKDALALLSFMINPRDEIAFRRVVNKPARGVGNATVDRIVGTAVMGPIGSLGLESAARAALPDLTAKARSGLTVFLNAIEGSRKLINMEIETLPEDGDDVTNLDTAARTPKEKKPGGTKKRDGLRAGEGLSSCVAKIVEDSGIAGYHLSRDDISGNQRIGNLQELINAASLYPATREGLLSFLEHIELDRSIETEESEEERGTVTLITLHNTKGLEFRRVIMTGIEQGVFPRDDKQGDDLEEERRLFYVGATRAMDELYLCTCAMRRVFGRTMPMSPSLFLSEADQSELRVIGKSPWGFAGGTEDASLGGGEASQQQETKGPRGSQRSSDGRWKQGDRVFHDDHGYGAVTEIRESDDGPVITVRFETGGETRFLSLHQSSRFLKLGNDV